MIQRTAVRRLVAIRFMIPKILRRFTMEMPNARILAPLAYFSQVDDKHNLRFLREILLTRPRGVFHSHTHSRESFGHSEFRRDCRDVPKKREADSKRRVYE